MGGARFKAMYWKKGKLQETGKKKTAKKQKFFFSSYGLNQQRGKRPQLTLGPGLRRGKEVGLNKSVEKKRKKGPGKNSNP